MMSCVLLDSLCGTGRYITFTPKVLTDLELHNHILVPSVRNNKGYFHCIYNSSLSVVFTINTCIKKSQPYLYGISPSKIAAKT